MTSVRPDALFVFMSLGLGYEWRDLDDPAADFRLSAAYPLPGSARQVYSIPAVRASALILDFRPFV